MAEEKGNTPKRVWAYNGKRKSEVLKDLNQKNTTHLMRRLRKPSHMPSQAKKKENAPRRKVELNGQKKKNDAHARTKKKRFEKKSVTILTKGKHSC
jgi:Mg-chelatase subunit ChlI